MLKHTLRFVGLLMCALLTTSSARAQTEPATYDDPFYKQKGLSPVSLLQRGNTFFQVSESVDPFTGNLTLSHTDIRLPGNGGLDLLIQRTYNSRIWGRRDVSNPGLVAINERSTVGLGWSLHFGRVRNPRGQGSANRFVPDNPIVEMPDGTQHVLYRDRTDTSRFITLERWRYRSLGGSPLQYELLLSDGTTYTFSQAAMYLTGDGVEIYQVKTIASPSGNTLTFAYDSTDARKLQSVVDSTGRTLTFSYSTVPGGACSYDALSSINVNGNVYRYEYTLASCNLMLTRVIPPTGPSWQYAYRTSNPGLHQLQALTYPNGGTITYTYADVRFDVGTVDIPFSVVTRRTVGGGRALAPGTWDYSYAATGTTDQVTTITKSSCGTERYTFSSFSALPNSGQVDMWRIGLPVRREVLDGASVVRSEIYVWDASTALSDDDVGSGAWNGTTGFLYATQVFSPQLASVTIQQDGATFTTAFGSYDSHGNPRSITETGNATRQTALTYFINTTRNMVRGRVATRATTVGGQTFTESFSYTPNGNVASHNRYGISTFYTYSSGNPASEADALGRTTSYTYSRGAVQRITRPLSTTNRTITWEGQISRETDGLGNATGFTYDAVGHVKSVAPPIGAAASFTYDSAGASRQVSRGGTVITESLDGFGRVVATDRSENLKTSRTYDACGRITFESDLYTTSALGDTRQYDVLGRVTRETHADGSAVRHSYLSDGVATTDEANRTVTRRYQTFGKPEDRRLNRVIDSLGTTTFTYNAVGSITRIDRPGGFTQTYTRDGKDLVTAENHPSAGSISYTRDAVGNATSRTDAVGTRTMQYDAHNRLLQVTYSGGSATFAYNANDQCTSAQNAAATKSYVYDSAGRLERETLNVGSNTFQTSYGYDSRGNVTSIVYPTGRSLPLTYDLADRVTRITGFVTAVAYHPSGGASSIGLANGRTLTRTYTNRNFLRTITSSGIVGLTYTYDGTGDITAIVDAVNTGRNQTLTYDAAHRLTGATGFWGSMSLDYDSASNRTRQTIGTNITNYVYDASGKLTSTNGAERFTFSYNGAGAVTSLTGASLAYDGIGCLTAYGTAATYACDADGRRVRRTDLASGEISLLHYDQWGQLLAETRPDGTRVAEYVYLNRELVSSIEPGTPTGTVSITSPANNAAVSGTSVTLSASATSPAGIAGVTFRLDSLPIGAEDTTSPYQVTWNSSSATNGAHQLSAVARLNSGGLLFSAPINIILSNVTPLSVSLTAPANNATVSGGSVIVSATASSSDGIAGVTFYVDGNPLGAEITTPPYQIAWNSTTVIDGAHQVSATARSTTNVTQTTSVNVVVANASVGGWTWISGASSIRQAGVYGTKGVAAPSNVPGARNGAVSWLRGSNELWLFGGFSTNGHTNDLWKFDGNNWTWMSGSSASEQAGSYGRKGIASATNVPGARMYSVSWTDASGNLWLFGGRNGAGQFNDLWKFNGSQWIWISGSSILNGVGSYGIRGVAAPKNVPPARWGAVSWRDGSGNLWVFGGSNSSGSLNDLWKFDGAAWTWIAGSRHSNQAGVYGTKGVPAPTNVPGGRYSAAGWVDAAGNLWLFGGYTRIGTQGGFGNDLWKFDGIHWTWVSGSASLNQRGNYGSRGVAASKNVPGARLGSIAWRDASGASWLFGGDGLPGGNAGSFNDLWKFDGSNWIWISGSTTTNQPGNYGTKGVPASSNVPGARTWSIPWIDAASRLWLFGGYSYSGGRVSITNDLWRWE
jgi:YD repeat-containing protein